MKNLVLALLLTISSVAHAIDPPIKDWTKVSSGISKGMEAYVDTKSIVTIRNTSIRIAFTGLIFTPARQFNSELLTGRVDEAVYDCSDLSFVTIRMNVYSDKIIRPMIGSTTMFMGEKDSAVYNQSVQVCAVPEKDTKIEEAPAIAPSKRPPLPKQSI